MNCIFWNANKQKVNHIIAHLISEYDCDLFSLAEYEDSHEELLKELADLGLDYYHLEKGGCERIDIFTRIKPSKIKILTEKEYYTFRYIPHDELGYVVFAFVHFPSKLFMDEIDYIEESRLLRVEIEKVETEFGTDFTAVVGDFNMNPFERGMMLATALHSFPTRVEALKKKRTVKMRAYSMFYNPMWSFLGDITPPEGTYHYAGSHYLQLYWNIFDQVIVRPSMIDYLNPKSIKIITRFSEGPLVNEGGIPTISDHLPLFFKLIKGDVHNDV